MGKIFVNYRREDSASQALNVAQYLEREFGGSSIFLDIDRLRAGQRFPKVLAERLSVSTVMLVVIGPTWLSVANEAGQRRIDDPEDWVRLEITSALARRIPVIPVLVGGASLPRKGDLPDELKPLVEHQVATITTNGFRNEMAGLARDIRDLLGARRRWPLVAGFAGFALAIGLAGVFVTNPSITTAPPSVATPLRTAKEAPQPENDQAPAISGTTTLVKWKGWHDCSGVRVGTTAHLTIDQKGGVTGYRDFYPTSQTPNTPSGSFQLRGQYDRSSGGITLVANDWIRQPTDFMKCDFVGTIDASGERMTGNSPGCPCGSFELRRERASRQERDVRN